MFPRWLKAVLALAVLGLLISGARFYHVHNQFLLREAYRDLEAVARLKVDQITEWRKGRLADAAVVMESPFLSQAAAGFLKNPESKVAEQMLVRFRSLQRHYEYRDVLIADATGVERLSLSGDMHQLHPAALEALRVALRDRRPVMTDLHFTPGRHDPHVDVVAPIFSNGVPLGAILLQADAGHFLYPLLQSWPVPTDTAETLLVRRDGDEVLYLNELRHRKDTALMLRVPLSRREMPAVMAVLGRKGVVRGRDYRGVEVLSAMNAVPDSPWFMVAKIDASEALSVARRESILILALILGLTAAAAATLAVVWQRNSKAHYRALLQAERAQRKIEERFKVTLFSVGDAVIATDASGRVELLNPVAERLTGWLQDEARGRPIEVVFHIINEKTRQPAENPVALVLRDGRIVGLANDTVLISREGREIAIEDSAAPIRDSGGETTGVVMVFHDVTAKRRAAANLRAAYDELEQRVQERTAELAQQAELISLAHDAIIVRDVEDRITFWSKGAEETYGWTADEAAGKVIHFLLDTQFPHRMEAMKTALFSGGRWDGELVHLKKDGSRITVMSRKVLRRDGNGEPSGILEINHDITEIKRVEQQLRQAQKLEAIGTLTGGIAHDFNNILAAVLGFGELARDRLAEGTRERLCLERITEAGLRGRNLVRRMLAFSRQAEQERTPLKLSSAIEETVKLLGGSIPATVDVRMKIESESGFILADPVQLQQVIMNLCTNAAYAMRNNGGVLQIELSDYSVAPSSPSGGMKAGSYMKLVVRDTGEGIPADIIEKIFDPFFTTKAPDEGTGLGLSVVHGIVKSHDGHIAVESEPGTGTTFTLCFPKVAEKQAIPTEADGPIPTGSERILFIDDEEALAEMGADILRDLGYDVVSATSAGEALVLVNEEPTRFDCVVTDQTMPEMTGIELAREILAIRPDIPVIMCTGFSHLVDAEEAKAAGIRVFAMKPLTKAEIAKTIRRVLDEQSSTRTARSVTEEER
jgi:PAS domain S-box-containing protein